MSYSLINLVYDAHDGNAMENLAKQFGMSLDNTERVVEAMLPAFSIGLKRNTANPLSLANFLSALQSGHHNRFFTDPMAAFSPMRRHEEDTILGHLLGSKQVSRAVADQVEAATGVTTSIVREMLPTVAAILMGGLAKEAPNNPLTMPIEAFAEGFARGRPDPKPEPEDFGVLDAFNSFFDGFGRGRDAKADDDVGDNVEPDDEQEEQPAATGEELFGSLFEAGLEIQRNHLKAINDIFNRAEEDDDD